MRGDFATTRKGIASDPLARGAGCFCMDGAIIRSVGATPWDTSLRRETIAALGFVQPSDLWCWQDVRRRTHEQVLARMDKAIVAVRRAA
jgi:hypothetical protein